MTNVFKCKQTTNKVPLNIFRRFERKKKGMIDVLKGRREYER